MEYLFHINYILHYIVPSLSRHLQAPIEIGNVYVAPHITGHFQPLGSMGTYEGGPDTEPTVSILKQEELFNENQERI